jgi:signal transduction histidine kinase
MAPNSPFNPADVIALCADATWQCATDLRLDHLLSIDGRRLSPGMTDLRGRPLDVLATQAVYASQTDALLGCLEKRQTIRDLTLSLLSPAGSVRNYMLNAAPRRDAQGNFRGYVGSLRVWDDVPFAEHRKSEVNELLRQADAAVRKEANLRHESDLLLAALQVLTEPTALQEKCVKLFRIIGPTLDFDRAVVIRRGLRAKMTVSASSDEELLGTEWPEQATPKAVLAGEARLVDGDDLLELAGALPGPLGTAKAALFAPLRIGSETAVLVLLGQRRDQFDARHLSVMKRISLIATKAFQEEDQKAALIASSKLAAMGELLATIAHEINQPVTIISMSASNGRMLLEDGSKHGEIDAKLERIETQARRAADIVTAVRQLSFVDRLSTGHEAIELREVLQAVETIARIALEKRDIALTVDIAEACPKVLGQASWLQQVVLNLITNARDAIADRARETPDRGPGVIRLEVGQAGDAVVLRVADNGGGVPEDIHERIFDPFFTLKEMGKGNGLGLALCRRLIADMDGQITLHNDDHGAVFEIRLRPAAADAVEPDGVPAENLATG